MSDIQWIEAQLGHAARRRQLLRLWTGLWEGLLWGGSVFLLTVVVFKVFPIPEAWVHRAGWAGLCLAFTCAIAAGWRRFSLMEVARFVDSHQGAKERLSTALEVSSRPTSGAWRDLVVADAARVLKETHLTQLLPVQLPQVCKWVVVVLAVGAGLGFVPEYRTARQKQSGKDAENIRDTGKQLTQFVKRHLDSRPPALEPVRKSMEAVQELGEHLARTSLTRAEALRDLAMLSDKLKEEAKELGKNPAFKKLEERSRNSGSEGANNAALRKKIDEMTQQLGSNAGDSKALEKLKKDLEKAREAASGLSGKKGSADSQAMDAMAKTMSDLAKQATELGASLPNLEKAIEALKNAEIDQVLKNLDLAEKDLEKMEQMARALESMQNEMHQAGKNLAEQLKNGQAEAAIQTLSKMQKALGKEGLTTEELEKITSEVSEAIKPASPYGKVAEHLKRASKQMVAGEKTQARQSLAEAAKELEKLMADMADGESMMASLDALQKAQMCIGNGMAWGQCKGPPKAGKNGKAGRGVGTWADEESQLSELPEVTERWDNTGVPRADTDSKGHSDRPDDRSDGLVPTKVKGQMNPGGPMPSITLKGLSVKGQSRVSFTESIPTAQSQAQSALSQDQVPRAYRGAVRDYFNDLKE